MSRRSQHIFEKAVEVEPFERPSLQLSHEVINLPLQSSNESPTVSMESRLNAALDYQQRTLDEINKWIADDETRRNTLKAQLEQIVEGRDARYEDLQSRISNLENSVRSSEHASEQIGDRLSYSDKYEELVASHVGELETKLDAFVSRMESLETRINGYESRVGEVEARMTAYESNVGSEIDARMKTRSDSLTKWQAECKAAISALRSATAGMQSQLDAQTMQPVEQVPPMDALQSLQQLVDSRFDASNKAQQDLSLRVDGIAFGLRDIPAIEAMSRSSGDKVKALIRTKENTKKELRALQQTMHQLVLPQLTRVKYTADHMNGSVHEQRTLLERTRVEAQQLQQGFENSERRLDWLCELTASMCAGEGQLSQLFEEVHRLMDFSERNARQETADGGPDSSTSNGIRAKESPVPNPEIAELDGGGGSIKDTAQQTSFTPINQ